jgi:myo-inositol-1(or 4)-monophosphatase
MPVQILPPEQRLQAVVEIAREAGALMRKRYLERDPRVFKLKGAQDYLTETDGEVERLVVTRLTGRFPGEAILGEEGGGTIGERTWIIDPIDGTANFARGVPRFCISIAGVLGREYDTGVVYDPIHDELFTARVGGGAHLNGKPIRVSDVTDMRRATIELGWSSRRDNVPYVKMVAEVLEMGAVPCRLGSGTLGIAYVAAGRCDGYAELHINAWDAAAALLIVREAGGRINDFLGGEGLTKGNPVLAATPGLWDELVRITGVG